MSVVEGQKAKKASKKASKAQRAINKLKNKQAQRAFLRGFRQEQAQALMAGIGAGVDVGSSLTQGLLASQETQKKVALREFAELEKLGGTITAQQMKQEAANFNASVYGSVANFAQSDVGRDILG